MKSCLVCQMDKTERKKEPSLLHPLPSLKDHGGVFQWTSLQDSLRYRGIGLFSW